MRSAVEPYPVLQHQPAPAAVPVRRGWWAGLLVLAVGAVAGAAPFLLGAGSVSVAAASAAAAMGVTVVLLTLLRRSRRIPGVVLLLCLVLAAGTVVVTDPAAQFHIATESVPGDGDSDYDYIYAGDIELDLRDREGQVTINAVASQLQLLLPEGATVEVNHLGSDIELPETETQAGTTTLHVEINALASTVTGTYE